ncbi:MAG: FMN-binding protein [Tissierellia bacterium]|nr:FMN-binding protein [Tissierellia bacterium]MDD4437088.1 FMN-binding protein [Tissierellia bacterium]
MKKHFSVLGIIFAIIILIIFVLIVGYIKVQSDLKELTALEIQDVDLSQIEDGYYEGSYNVFPIAVEVNVYVKNHEIIDIKILKHTNGQGGSAEKITEHIMKLQSLDVDAISGATYSSKIIIKAVENALEKEKK